MGMTTAVKDELSTLTLSAGCCRRAELATLLRFAGEFTTAGGRMILEATFDHGPTLARLRKTLTDLYHCSCQVQVWPAPGARTTPRYVLRVADGAALARHTGLLDRRAHPVRGLPAAVVAGRVCDAAAVWRAAFLARGQLTDHGARPTLDIDCPGPETALALAGAARRLGITTKTRQGESTHQMRVRNSDAIGELLTQLGAPASRAHLDQQRTHRQARNAAHRLPNFDDANLRRAAQAAHTATIRAERALEILGDTVPDHLAATAALRLQHRDASLETLGRLADPPLTKDAIAGRLRRLLALADTAAHHRGIPDTTAAAG